MRLRTIIAADLDALHRTQERYSAGRDSGARSLLGAIVSNIGFQQLCVFRVTTWFSRHRLTPMAMIGSRLIRHLYGAEMHWNAVLAPGVVLVHGNGLVISRAAVVETGCILAQSVTLGVSLGANGVSGAPRLEHDVHVGPGAVIVGPITIGTGSKIAPNAFVSSSVPPRSTVSSPPATVTPR